ncbi:acyltransferase family protein [Cellulosimicrobium cellulans]|uniref:acyltransferase family protein n=1 Tax=Cellulosimicrobium cellulans TaxID=1710 RepID=UPI00130EC454|nr:acyltransferase [Cellulosimicrobium cellulans]
MKTSRIAGLDALRGVAVLLVMAHHALPEALPGSGAVGVVMFFTLSGWLVTGLLLDELEATGRVRLLRFFARRARRLLPALGIMLAGFTAVTWTLDPLGERQTVVRALLVALGYLTNLPITIGSRATFHLWTLATEAQFYVLWPVIVMIAWRARRMESALAWSGVVVLAGCVLTLAWAAPDYAMAYRLPFSWSLALVIGATAQWASRRGTPTRTRPARGSRGMVVLVVLVLAGCSLMALQDSPGAYVLGGPAIAGATCVIISRIVAGARAGNMARSPAAHHAMRALGGVGVISYAAYLWNYPLVLWLRTIDAPLHALLSSAATFALAAVSWHAVEKHAITRRLSVRSRPRETTSASTPRDQPVLPDAHTATAPADHPPELDPAQRRTVEPDTRRGG